MSVCRRRVTKCCEVTRFVSSSCGSILEPLALGLLAKARWLWPRPPALKGQRDGFFYKTLATPCHSKRQQNLTARLYLSLALVFLGVLGKELPGWAYTDNILASKKEVWAALVEVMETKGISSQDFDKGKIKSKWIEDVVLRENRLMRSILKATRKRRSRYEIYVTEQGVETNLQIKGTYQFKPSGADFRVVWKNHKPTYEDRLTEQEIFYNVLRVMGDKKMKEPALTH